MKELFGVDELDACDHLIEGHEYCLHAELPVAEGEQIFQRWPQQVHYHDVEFALRGAIVNLRDASFIRVFILKQMSIELGFEEELRMLSADRLELDRHLRVRFQLDYGYE